MSVHTVHSVADLRQQLSAWRAAGDRIALVPTMGALHAGHLGLVRLAQSHVARVVTSVFVNPLQFGAHEDFGAYPRTLPADSAALATVGCDLLFAPAATNVYPTGFATTIHVGRLGDRWEGAARPGHFDGVATVVTKLLTMAAPDIAVFGEKDWQQLAIIRRLVADLDLPVTIIPAPIARDPDGLALSSRNAYLSATARTRAAALPAALTAAVARLQSGASVATVLAEAQAAILAGGFDSVDYVALTDANSLEPLDTLDRPARLLATARIEGVRLLDNVAVTP
ncbi:pantoate--beta-alanine ligase [Sandaracinobacteroides saxicola]|uniref:Pantothenate synthetase n=1 Tax=Sandaracinobacteroides saxicola TaxID=2759707 RepID=A0A7G5IKK9_9SPHN|nr:pantoate--beta-alanine ligase [Sandaracinobacteroides saxicola]QMW23901.1 pantoate--beta-alanine ligase [Sandaracinobacteroides saxicola]